MPALDRPGRPLPDSAPPEVAVTEPSRVADRRVSLEASPDGILVRFHIDPFAGTLPHRIQSIRIEGDTADSIFRSETGVARRFHPDGPILTERAHVLHDLPCAIIEWAAAPGEVRNVPLRRRLTIVQDPDAEGVAVTADDGFLRLDLPGDGALIAVSHADARLELRDDGWVWEFETGMETGLARLAVIAIGQHEDDPDAILTAARRADSRILARAATLRRRNLEGLSLQSPDPVADRAIRDAVHHLDAVPLDRVSPDGSAVTDLALAALAAGEFDIAHDLIAALISTGHNAGPLGSEFLGWTGDPVFVPGGRLDTDPGAGRADAPPIVLTVRTGGGPDAVADPIQPVERAGLAFTDFEAGEPATVSQPILTLVRDLVGTRPDAVRGRLVLSPILPAGWDGWEVRNLRLGDSRVRLSLRADPARWQIEIEQTDGAIPLRAILEPVIPARSLVKASVDGVIADLAPRRVPTGLLVPVQLVLDHPRRLILELG